MTISSFELVDLGEESIAVPVGEDAAMVSGVLKLNPSGKELFSLLQTNSVEEVIEILSQKYDNQTDELAKYVRDFVKVLTDYGITVE